MPAAQGPYKRSNRLLMVGTHPLTMGGVSSVVRGYMAGGLFARVPGSYITTHRDGNPFVKATTAAGAWLRVVLELFRGGAPLLHIHLSSRASFWRKAVICLMAVAARRPYLLHVHGSEFMTFYDEECGPAAKRFVAWIFRHAATVIALSEQWRENIRRICTGAEIVVLPNAVPIPDLRSRNPATPHIEILFLGRLGLRKGTFDLLEAFSRIAAYQPLARLICAGDGAIGEVMTVARDRGIDDRLECPGWLDQEATSRRLSSASIFVLPSYAEGMPMALLEAMSWGLPVITSPVGGIPQLVKQDANGVLVAPGDVDGLAGALLRLLDGSAERDRLGAAARATIERDYSLTTSLERLIDLYARFGIPHSGPAVAQPRQVPG